MIRPRLRPADPSGTSPCRPAGGTPLPECQDRGREPVGVLMSLGIAALVVVCVTAPAFAYEREDHMELPRMAIEGRFDELTDKLNRNQERFEAGLLDELSVLAPFGAFAKSDPGLEPALLSWAEDYPAEFAPRLALGMFHMGIGNLIRGNMAESYTPDIALEQRRAHLERAWEYFDQALAINPRLVAAHYWLIITHQFPDLRDERSIRFREAVAALPDSSRIVRAYAIGLPLDQVAAFVSEARALHPDDPAFSWMDGFQDFAMAHRGTILSDDERLELFDRAIAAADEWYYIYHRAIFAFHARRYRRALTDFDTLLPRGAETVEVHVFLGRIYSYLGHLDRSLEHLDRAIEMDPLRPDALTARAWVFARLGQFEREKTDREAALIHGRYLHHLHRDMARFYMSNHYEPALAARYWQQAIDLYPQFLDYRVSLSSALHRQRDCRAVSVYEEYLRLCQAADHCRPIRPSFVGMFRFMDCPDASPG